jgi:hypothetical protein
MPRPLHYAPRGSVKPAKRKRSSRTFVDVEEAIRNFWRRRGRSVPTASQVFLDPDIHAWVDKVCGHGTRGTSR